jgi:hypothetical protein
MTSSLELASWVLWVLSLPPVVLHLESSEQEPQERERRGTQERAEKRGCLGAGKALDKAQKSPQTP